MRPGVIRSRTSSRVLGAVVVASGGLVLASASIDSAPTDEEVQVSYSHPLYDELWNYGDPAATETRFRELLPEVTDPDRRLQLLTQIARTQGLQRKFDEAHATLDEVSTKLDDARASDGAEALPVVGVRLDLERGRALNSSGAPEKSRPHFAAAWERSRAHGLDFYAVDAAHMMAIVESGDDAVAWFERAREVAEASDDARTKKWLGSLLNNLGWTYHDAGQYEKALETFEACRTWHEEYGNDTTRGIAVWTVARCLRSLGRAEEALAMQESLYAANPDGEGYTEEELGECLWVLGRKDEARGWFEKAHAKLSKDAWLQANDAERLARLERLAGGADE